MPCSTSATGTSATSNEASARAEGTPASAGREAFQAIAVSTSQPAAVLKYKSESGISVPVSFLVSSLPIPHARRPDAAPFLRREDAPRTLADHRGERAGDGPRGATRAPRRRRGP